MDIYFDPRLLAASETMKTSGAGRNAATDTSFQDTLIRQNNSAVTAPSLLDNLFSKASQKYGVPENLLKAVAKAESDFQSNCVSSAGASGIMQLMPDTAKEYGITNILDPEQNIMGGAHEIANDLKRYGGNIKLALAGYNAGCGNVDKYGGVPPFSETQNYVRKVMKLMGEDINVPNTPLAASASSSGSGVDTSGLAQLAAAGGQASTGADTAADFTYQDYQMFVGIIVNALKNGWESESQNAGSANGLNGRWY